jgi:hypothetical protein
MWWLCAIVHLHRQPKAAEADVVLELMGSWCHTKHYEPGLCLKPKVVSHAQVRSAVSTPTASKQRLWAILVCGLQGLGLMDQCTTMHL